MRKHQLFVLPALAVACTCAVAQTLPTYLEISHAHVKGERSKEFEDGIRKLVDVERRLKGDRWVAISTEYGEPRIMFSSSRENMAAVESGVEAFMKALKEGMGPFGEKLMRDLGGMAAFRNEIRRRRWDLSVHPPADAAELSSLVGHTRWIRTVKVDVKPGRAADYIDAWKGFQTELASVSPPVTALVSESNSGTPAIFVGLYYRSMAEMDDQMGGVQKAVASAAYKNLMKVSGDAVAMTNWEMHRMRPELSNPPDDVVNTDPSFWKPKPPAAAAKPKTEAAPQKK